MAVNSFINISTAEFEQLFPFYFIINRELEILATGKSLQKLIPGAEGSRFSEVFHIKRPHFIYSCYNDFDSLTNQVIILQHRSHSKILLRGQFIQFRESNQLLFAGAPWITSAAEMQELNLNINDFALHNNTTDMIQVIKSMEIANDDIRELASVLHVQKHELKAANNRFKNLISHINAGILVENNQRKIILTNQAFCKLFRIHAGPEQLTGLDCADAARHLQDLFEYPDHFIEGVAKLLNEKKTVTGEIVTLKDGTIMERDFIPVYEEGELNGIMWLYRDVTLQKKLDLQIKQNEEKYRSIIENLKLGLLEVDTENRITKAYSTFCELSGYEEEELLGRNVEDLLWDKADAAVMSKQSRKRELGEADVYDIRIRKKDGTLAWHTVSGAPIYNLHKEITGSIGINIDITDRKLREYELKHAKELAENLLHVKRQFMANISHEIRTPLNVIIGMSDMIAGNNSDPMLKEDLSIMQKSASQLLSLINNVLDISKIEAGKMELKKEKISLKQMLLEQVQLQILEARKKRNHIKFYIDPETPVTVYSDELRLKQIITNLLNNAIKFTDNGTITLTCLTVHNTPHSAKILLQISDTGIGIPEENIETVFNSFEQAHHLSNRLFGGTGLGLSIVKNIVDAMGGRIWCESIVGNGSIFNIELELSKHQEECMEPVKDISETSDLKGLRVLLTEDNEFNTLVARRLLQKWKCKVSCADNGQDCLLALQESDFDVVLMDLQMPVMGGYEAVMHIRKSDNVNVRNIPVIAMTAHAFEGLHEKCIAAGMNDVVSKPFSKEELYIKLRRIHEQKKFGSYAQIALKVRKFLETQFENDTELMEQILELFVSETPKAANKIKNFIHFRDSSGIRRTLHKIKPHVKTLCLEDLLSKIVDAEDEMLGQTKETSWQKMQQLVNELEESVILIRQITPAVLNTNA
jgi:two-component system, sensor histidine kinase